MKSLTDLAGRSLLSLDKLVWIEEYILNTGYMTAEKVRRELEWFLIDLGIDEYYFRTTPEADIARHLIALSASDLITQHGGEGGGVQLISEREDKAVYIVEDVPEKTAEIEERIEKSYQTFHLESYMTRETSRGRPLRFYIMFRPVFQSPELPPDYTFEDASSRVFMARAVPETVARYRDAWERMNDMESPYISVSDKKETGETRIMIGMKGREHRRLLTMFSHLIARYGLHVRRKYIEPFMDNKCITSFYFPKLKDALLTDLTRDLNVTLMLPDNPLTELFYHGTFSPQKAMYAVSAAVFTHQFLSLLTDEYMFLQRSLKDQPEARGIVDNLKHHLVKDTYSSSRIANTILTQTAIVEQLYDHFRDRVAGRTAAAELDARKEKIRQAIDREVPYSKDRAILHHFLIFNDSIQRTNFFNSEKTCMAYRLDAGFLEQADFPERPYGLFFLVGRDFLGFHMRFRDIARGGIRIVRSRSIDLYAQNIDTIFTENYNLALTQQRKNKDIPEGGAKGTILLNLSGQDAAERAFKDYVDGLLDLLVEKDKNGKLSVREILFLGPDEGTAGLMEWAALHARRRSYPFWKAFSTGKSPEIGGIPHDLYGMTTIGVHQYVLGVLEKNGVREEDISKIQTGGPDGDLGSNEILISRDKTLAVIDGSGVLFDPAGLDRGELGRLAEKRVMVQEFDRKRLSKEGFFVSVNDRDVRLPDGSTVKNGEEFRNSFHLHKLARADLFVPCGGRPGAVNIGNWKQLFDAGGSPKFRFIVEGANLFITEEARLRLEENGIAVLKDASTNKGGVTSSSFEVLASLALSDPEYDEHMCARGDAMPALRKAYVEGILERIRFNARSEFELLWKEKVRTGTPLATLSNLVSGKINQITDAIRVSAMAGDPELRRMVLLEYIPRPLVDFLGIDTVLKRVPDAYIQAIVATKMATDFVYAHGLEANEVDFANYVDGLKGKAR